MSPARGENRMCSHPRTGDATDKKIAEKNREKFNELNFLQQNHGLCQRVATLAIFARAGDATISKKSHHHRKQKIARVAAALGDSRYIEKKLSECTRKNDEFNSLAKMTNSINCTKFRNN